MEVEGRAENVFMSLCLLGQTDGDEQRQRPLWLDRFFPRFCILPRRCAGVRGRTAMTQSCGRGASLALARVRLPYRAARVYTGR